MLIFVTLYLTGKQVAEGARVVYGDGTSGALIRAAGVQNPTAIAITYEESDRCLRATECLREAFPDTPIFVRSMTQSRVKDLIRAGATEVIVATGTVASGMGQLLGVRRNARFGSVVDDSVLAFGNMASSLYPAMEKATEDKLSGLAEEIDSDDDPELTRKLFKLFSTSLTLNDDGQAQLSELASAILRTSDFFESDQQVADLLECETLNNKCWIEADDRYVTFSEFVGLYRKVSSCQRTCPLSFHLFPTQLYLTRPFL